MKWSCGVQTSLWFGFLALASAPNWWLVIGALVLLLLVVIWIVDHHAEPGESA